MNGFILIKERSDISVGQNYFFAEVDGSKAKDIDGLFDEMIRAFKLPNYFGRNYNALNECINDLEWIEENNYILFINNYNDLLTCNTNIYNKEEALYGFLEILENAAQEWTNVPNFEFEDDFRVASNFIIYALNSKKIKKDLNTLGIKFKELG